MEDVVEILTAMQDYENGIEGIDFTASGLKGALEPIFFKLDIESSFQRTFPVF